MKLDRKFSAKLQKHSARGDWTYASVKRYRAFFMDA
jgi:hypothetical protein